MWPGVACLSFDGLFPQFQQALAEFSAEHSNVQVLSEYSSTGLLSNLTAINTTLICFFPFPVPVTHVVTATDKAGTCARTLKYLLGVVSGKWIVSLDCMSSRA